MMPFFLKKGIFITVVIEYIPTLVREAENSGGQLKPLVLERWLEVDSLN